MHPGLQPRPHLPSSPSVSPRAGTTRLTTAATAILPRPACGAGPSNVRGAGSEARGSPDAPLAFPQCFANAAMEAGRTAVLRVKRKRTAEPAEALVLACKRLRNSEVESAAQKTPEGLERASENNVFQLVATVRSQVSGR